MANPSPVQNDRFKAWQQRGKGDRPLSSIALSVKFHADVYKVLREMSDRQSYIRHAVEKQLKADGLLGGNAEQ